MQFQNNLAFARRLDQEDPLRKIRDQFIIPADEHGTHAYFLGNSLGLQPQSTGKYVEEVMRDWSQLGVEAFFHAKNPWLHYHDFFSETLSTIVGAQRNEVVVMNQLTVNVHLLMASFYRPAGKRFRIICEAKAFPSDQYALETHVRFYGFNPDEAIIEVSPREGEYLLRTEDIVATIHQYRDEAALVLMGGINYYSGQVLDMPAITKAAHDAGCYVIFDLAHAAGNIRLALHDWNVDAACWCSYKYLNSGPGAIAGVFVHSRHHQLDRRLTGWWGYDKPTRFRMDKGFVPMPGAEGWQLSTPSILLYACHRAALEVLANAGWENVLEKADKLTDYLWFVLQSIRTDNPLFPINIITPPGVQEHGRQVSLLVTGEGRALYDKLMQEKIMVDWREPDVIRLAPVPLYNTFEEIWKFGQVVQQFIQSR